jgi:hypothetical protein
MARKFNLILLLGLLLVSPQLSAGEEPRYPILDSKFPAAEAKLGWIDNERVIFQGYELGKFGTKRSKDGHLFDITRLFVWNTTTNTVIKHASMEGLTTLCVHSGEVTFAREGMLVTGKLGKEVRTTFPKKNWFNPNSCRYYTERPYWSEEGRIGRGIPLLEQHGYVDFGEQSMDPVKSRPLVLYPPGSKNGVTLPLKSDQVDVPPLYVDFVDAYLLRAIQHTSDAAPVWLLKPDGAVTQILEPRGESWERMGWAHSFLTKKGLFLVGGQAGYDTVGTAGAYLLRNNHPQRLIGGLVWSESVSPDGCKVAFVHVPHSQAGADSFHALQTGKPGARTLKMINLCKGD